ncbi:hypothetical protein O0V09_02140 [Dasania sp. GY-19]|uniref:Ankyrin repeat domain-containing protein n=2 Tax=Dasania phycosphaerae TaxID=2950436 RepID=A0A9J6RHQ4_9GAMM|nr:MULTISPECIES: hypothetical protein [Dasania]MCZ0863980.1 hypothetical protein [Dasania phycosphaerae]
MEIKRQLTQLFGLILLVLMVVGCSGFDYQKNKETHTAESRVLLSGVGDINRQSPLGLTPLAAAIMHTPERVPELIAKGADVNAMVPSVASNQIIYEPILTLAVLRPLRAEIGGYALPYDDTHDLQMIEAMLQAGADPNAVDTLGSSVLRDTAWDKYSNYYKKGMKTNTDPYVKRAELLVRYGADRSTFESIIKHAKLRQKYGIAGFLEEVLFFDTLEAYYKYKRGRAIYVEKRDAIRQYFDNDADLKAAVASLRETAAPCFTSGRMYSQASEFTCIVSVYGDQHPSPACEDYQRQLLDALDREKDKLCPPYRKQRKQLAKLFGEHSSQADDVIGEKMKGVASVASLERQYANEINRMKRIRDRFGRSEKAAADNRDRQNMYSFAQHIQQAVGSSTVADQIIEKSVADTQRTLYAIDNAQKMAKINADIAVIEKRLAGIEASTARGQSVSTSAAAGGKSGDVSMNYLKPVPVCGGPYTAPEFTAEFDWGNGMPRDDVAYKCKSGDVPAAVGSAATGAPNYVFGPTPDIQKLGGGKHRYTRKAFQYECVCSSGGGTSKRAVSQ